MPDYWSVPLATGVIGDLDSTIAKGPDLSWIGNLPDAYWQGKNQAYTQANRDVFKNGLPKDPNGNVDWSQVSQDLARVGGSGSTQNVIGLQNLQIARDALGSLNGVFAPPSSAPAIPNNVPRAATPTNNPGNIENGPFASSQPGYVQSNGRFASFSTPQAGDAAAGSLLTSYASKGVVTPNAIASRWAPAGDGSNDPQAYGAYIARQLGVDPNAPLDLNDPNVRGKVVQAIRQFEGNGTSGQPVQTAAAPVQTAQAPAPQGQAPQQVAQATPAPVQTGNINEGTAANYEARAQKAYQAATALSFSNPQAGARLQAMGDQLMQQAKVIRQSLAKNAEVTPETKNYSQAVSQGYKGSQQQYQADIAGQTKEAETQVTNLNKLADAGIDAKGKIGQLNAIQQLGEKVGYGAVPKLQSLLGQYGIDTKGLSDIQAYERAIDFMAPQLRPVGSGRLMQQELTAFKSSLGGLMTTPEGRRISIDNLKLINNYASQVGAIAADTSLPPSQRYEKIYSLEPPRLTTQVPNAGGQGQSSQFQEGQTATNPKTGERLMYRNGKWEPFT